MTQPLAHTFTVADAEVEADSYPIGFCFRPEADITGNDAKPILSLRIYLVNRNASSTRAKAGEGCLRLG